jgi:hypothetical protein
MASAMMAVMMSFYRQLVLVDRTTGVNIGNCTGSGGLAAAFDGVTNQAVASCARSNGLNPGWIGKYRAGAPKILGRMTIYAPNNQNINGANGSGITGNINIYGKTVGQSTTSTDGTLLYSGTFVDGANGVGGNIIDVTSGIVQLACESILARIDFGTNTGFDVNLAEVVMYELI